MGLNCSPLSSRDNKAAVLPSSLPAWWARAGRGGGTQALKTLKGKLEVKGLWAQKFSGVPVQGQIDPLLQLLHFTNEKLRPRAVGGTCLELE